MKNTKQKTLSAWIQFFKRGKVSYLPSVSFKKPTKLDIQIAHDMNSELKKCVIVFEK